MDPVPAIERLKLNGIAIEHLSELALEVSGADALDWLEGMVTADLRDSTRVVHRSLFLDRVGKIQAEVLVWREGHRVILFVVGGERMQLLEHLSRYVIMEDVEIRPVDSCLYSLHGPKSSELLGWTQELEGIQVEKLPWLTENDVVCSLPRAQRGQMLRCIERCGIQVEGNATWHDIRVELGVAAYGCDYFSSDTPGTAGLVEELVSLSKGCYLGQEVVCKMLMRGATRERSVRLRFDAPPPVGAEILAADSEQSIGRITSVGPAAKAGTWAIGRVKTSALGAVPKVVTSGISGEICLRRPLQ